MADPDSAAVLRKIKDDGTFDEIRHKVVDELKKNADLRDFTTQLVHNSEVLQAADFKKANKKQLFDALRKELFADLMAKAEDAAWSVLSSPESEISQLIDEKVHAALCTVYEKRHEEEQLQWGKDQQAHQPFPVAMPSNNFPQQNQQRKDYRDHSYAPRQRHPSQGYEAHSSRAAL